MGTLAFIILRFVLGYDFYGDMQTFVELVSLDSIAVVLFLGFFGKKKDR